MNSPRLQKPEVLFVISIDAEERWDWSGPFPDKTFNVDNIQRVPRFQAFCEGLGLRPTYFTDYPVVVDPQGAAVFRELAGNSNCEIGAHLHPWANPPFYEATDEIRSHVVNLPIEQARMKLDSLLEAMETELDVRPQAFRTGRWGINAPILELLRARGFTVDSSMYPCYSNEFFDCEETPLSPYFPNFDHPTEEGSQRDIMEVPVTVGFNWRNQAFGRALYKRISNPRFEPFRVVGAFWQSHLLRKIYLSPEVMSGREMRPLVDKVIANGHPVLHMFLHSSSLVNNSQGIMSHPRAFETISHAIEELLDHLQEKAAVRFCTISEAAALIQHWYKKHAA
ncbi:MAG: polysaccharide deacetylase family protein [Pseudomonadota bacterium]